METIQFQYEYDSLKCETDGQYLAGLLRIILDYFTYGIGNYIKNKRVLSSKILKVSTMRVDNSIFSISKQ